MPKLTIVVPVWNDTECMRPFYEEVSRYVSDFRIVWVVDPPLPKPGECLIPSSQFIFPSVRWGQEACILHGVRVALESTASLIAVMDVDLQDPPSLLPEMMNIINRGYDVAWPVHPTTDGRTLLYKTLSAVWYLIMTIRCPQIPRFANSFCMMNRKTAERVSQSKETWARKAIAASICNGYLTIPFHRPARKIGESKYQYAGRDFADTVRRLFK